MSTIIESIEKEQLRSVPQFAAGDRVRVHFRVVEGARTRTQVFEGVVIRRQGSGARETFTVRKQSFGVGVERTFPVHSPKIEQLEVAARGDVRRAKLYYLRDRVGKAARIAERRWGITDDVLPVEEDGAIDAEGTSQDEAESELAEVEPELAEVEPEERAEQEGEQANASKGESEPSAGDASSDAAADAGPRAADDAAPEDVAAAEPAVAADAAPESEAGDDAEDAAPVAESDADADGEAEADSSDDEASEQDS